MKCGQSASARMACASSRKVTKVYPLDSSVFWVPHDLAFNYGTVPSKVLPQLILCVTWSQSAYVQLHRRRRHVDRRGNISVSKHTLTSNISQSGSTQALSAYLPCLRSFSLLKFSLSSSSPSPAHHPNYLLPHNAFCFLNNMMSEGHNRRVAPTFGLQICSDEGIVRSTILCHPPKSRSHSNVSQPKDRQNEVSTIFTSLPLSALGA